MRIPPEIPQRTCPECGRATFKYCNGAPGENSHIHRKGREATPPELTQRTKVLLDRYHRRLEQEAALEIRRQDEELLLDLRRLVKDPDPDTEIGLDNYQLKLGSSIRRVLSELSTAELRILAQLSSPRWSVLQLVTSEELRKRISSGRMERY